MSNTADCRATNLKHQQNTLSQLAVKWELPCITTLKVVGRPREARGEPILEPLCLSYLGTDEHDVGPSLDRVGDEVSPLLLQLD